MKKATLYTLDVDMIKDLNRKKPRGQRSAFVNAAIRARLDGESGFNLEDESTKEILAELRYRRDLPEWFMSQVVLVRKEMEE
tara:strand:- start:320 stop:565 length:246 start_codon:yes stop_codon:yes gene_type:complete